jgi:thiosulfate/3-mercaptopyruvate sulfurtransferase
MGYVHNDALVSTEWLAARLGDPSLRIVDASYFVPGGTVPAKEQFGAGHIPGAVYFDINEVADPEGTKDHTFPSAAIFAAKVGALGIGNRHHVIAYDSFGGGCAAARVWFMFRAFGHDKVAVLNGGLGKWKAEGRPLATASSPLPPEIFRAVDPKGRLKLKADMRQNATSRGTQVVDARSAGRFEGTEPEPRPGLRSGHIPGSRNLPWASLFDKTTREITPSSPRAAPASPPAPWRWAPTCWGAAIPPSMTEAGSNGARMLPFRSKPDRRRAKIALRPGTCEACGTAATAVKSS